MSLDDEALGRLLDLAFDHVCALRVADVVDPVDIEGLLSYVDAATRAERVGALQRRLLTPARERWLERAAKSEVLVSAWLPAAVREQAEQRMGAPMPLPRRMVDELVGSEKVRDEVRSTLLDTLTGFLRKASAAEGPAAGLRGAIGLGAKAFAQAGKGLLGGLGDELQRQMSERARDFVDASVGAVQERIARKLLSPETAAALGRRRGAWFVEQLGRTEAQAGAWVRGVWQGWLDERLPDIVEHNAARPEVRAALVDEARALVADLSTQTIGAWLDEAGVRELARASLREKGLPIARALVASPAFEAWQRGAPGRAEG